LHKNRQEDQLIRIEDLDINPYSWFSTKKPKKQDGENTASSTDVAGKTGYPHVEDWN
jgi:hypothetical protein